MLSNTGLLSFLLYGVFIFVTIVAMCFAFYHIKKGTIETTKLDKMIELFKYVIVSTSIATVTLIAADLFKEREQDIKELEYFDKYIDDVKKVDGIQERLQLSKYLSIVAPSGEMKKSWENYYKVVESEYKDYLNLKSEQLNIKNIANPTNEQNIRLQKTQEKISMYEKPLSNERFMTIDIAKMVCDAKAYIDSKQFENAIKIFKEIEYSEEQYLNNIPEEIQNLIKKYSDDKDVELAAKEYDKHYSKIFKCK